MWQPKHPANDTVAILGFLFSLISTSLRPPLSSCFFDFGADRLPVVKTLSDRNPERRAFYIDSPDRAHSHGPVRFTETGIGEFFRRVNPEACFQAPSDQLEDMLAVKVPTRLNTPAALDAPVTVEEDIGMRGIH
jgi:hypothetical protein